MKNHTFTAPVQKTEEITVAIPSFWVASNSHVFARTAVWVVSKDHAIVVAFIRDTQGKISYAGTVVQNLESVRGFADRSLSECTEEDFRMLQGMADKAIVEATSKILEDGNRD